MKERVFSMSKKVETKSVVEVILESEVSKSEKMRQLYDNDMTVSEISKLLNSHYSFVYGVIQRHCEDSGIEMKKVTTTSKSDIIRELYDSGLTVGEISKQLNSNYSYVFSVVKKHREKK